MRRRLFMLASLLLLVGLALGTRYGDVILYTTDRGFAAATLVVFAAFCFWWLPDHSLVALSTDWTSLLLPVAVVALTLLSPYRYGAQVQAAEALAITSGEPCAIVAKAFCALARGETARAKELLTSIAKQDFTNTSACYGLSPCYRALGDTVL
jgi:hypothetical protein